MPDAISLGPLALPPTVLVGLIAIGGALLALGLMRRSIAQNDSGSDTGSAEGTGGIGDTGLKASAYPANARSIASLSDRLVTALLVAFLVWKVTPLVFFPGEILADPVRLLRLPGGRAGVFAGSVAGILVVIPLVFRNRSVLRALSIALAAGALSGAIALGFLTTLHSGGQSAEGARVRLTEVPVRSLSGEETTLRDEQDSPTVLTFWATWCGPCHAEIPVKREAFRRLSDRAAFVAVNMTNTEGSPASVLRYLEEEDIDYPVVLDPNGTTAALFSVRGTPTTVVLASDGTVVARWMGPSDLGRIERTVERALGR